MDTCNPNVTCANITGNKFITTFKCMSGTQEDLEDALKSFPSGHASFVGFVAFFIVFYIHERFRSFGSVKTTLRPFSPIDCIRALLVVSPHPSQRLCTSPC